MQSGVSEGTINSIFGALLILMILIPGSIKGPMTLSLPSENPLIKLAWRTQGGLVISLAILAVMYFMDKTTMSLINNLTLRDVIDSVVRSFFSFIWGTSFILGCSMTITSHAQVTYNATGIYIVVLSMIVCSKVSKYELIGHGFWVIGAALIILDPRARKMDSDKPSLIGFVIPFIGAGFGAILIFMSHNIQKWSPVFIITEYYLFSVIYQLVFFPWFIESDNFFFIRWN